MNKENLFWQVYLNLEDEVLKLSNYVFFTDTTTKINNKTKKVMIVDCNHQLETYSTHIADLLIRCCVEIEAISKELYFENGGTKPRGSNDVYFDTDCMFLLNNSWKLDNKVAIVVASNTNFTKDENRVLLPLKDADKRSKSYWAKAYQAVKHDRYNSLYRGNVKALLQAMGALYLLNIYYKDIKLSSTYLEYRKIDMSFGSKIFTLKLPSENALTNAINGINMGEKLESNDSPYIIKYTDSAYKEIITARQKALDDMNSYWKSQPELKEPLFLHQLMEARQKEERDPRQRVVHLWELCKYRLKKRIPAALPFEERKKLFVQSSEWSGHIRQINEHLNENELTAENIQAEIDRAGIKAGIELNNRFEFKWMRKAFNYGHC